MVEEAGVRAFFFLLFFFLDQREEPDGMVTILDVALYQTSEESTISYKVPGEIKRSRDLRGGRWSWTFKLAQKRS